MSYAITVQHTHQGYVVSDTLLAGGVCYAIADDRVAAFAEAEELRVDFEVDEPVQQLPCRFPGICGDCRPTGGAR